MKKNLKFFFLITVPVLIILFLILELVFRLFIPACEIPLSHFDINNSIYRFHPDQAGLYTFGRYAQYRGKWRINNFGWNSPIDYKKEKQKARIAVIGDSYIEAFNVDIDESYPYRLKAKLGDKYEVYSFGKSGAPFSQYLNMSRYVSKYFDPDILIFNIVANDFDQSILKYNTIMPYYLTLSISDSCITEDKPVLKKDFTEFIFWKRFIRGYSALIRYLSFNLHFAEFRINLFTKRHDKAYESNVDVDLVKKRKDEITLATKYMIGRIEAENPNKKIVFVLDAPRDKIYTGKSENSEIIFLHDLMKDLCGEYGLYLLDLTFPMKTDYDTHHRRFNPTIDNHWNAYGHQLIADELYKFLSDHRITDG